MAIKLIIGLRNPGDAYEKTRHNAGEWFVKALARTHHASFKVDKKRNAEIAEIQVGSSPLLLVLPFTFMNHSGQVAYAVSHFYRIEAPEILTAHDELDLPVGRIKLKSGGGHGGHNGLRDMITQLHSNEFYRLRIGIGHPGHKALVHSFVLGKPPEAERASMAKAIEQAVAVMPLVCAGHMAQAMNKLHASLDSDSNLH